MAPDRSPVDLEHQSENAEAQGALRRAVEGIEVVDGAIDPESLVRSLQITLEAHRGPLPTPDVLARYDEVLPGLARIMVDQWQAETRNRHETNRYDRETDRIEVRGRLANQRLGLHYGALAVLALVAVAAFAIALGEPIVGLAGMASAVAWVVWAMRRDPRNSADGLSPSAGDAIERAEPAEQSSPG
jgi:uncharacterized membrane protein